MKIVNISNDKIRADVNNNGLIYGLYTFIGDTNLADKNGFGSISYTLKGDDITTDKVFCPYSDLKTAYDIVSFEDNTVNCKNTELAIETSYTLCDDRLIIEATSDDSRISQFGIDLNMNFLGKRNGTYVGQLLPSSPYTSNDEEKMYCIMPVIEYGYCIIIAKTPCKAWKINYSDYSAGHFINSFQILSALDDHYCKESHPHIVIEIAFAKTIEESYKIIQKSFDCPMLCPDITGNFGTSVNLKLLGEADCIKVIHDGEITEQSVSQNNISFEFKGYGMHTVIPFKDGKAGLDTVVWSGGDMLSLFEKSCDKIEMPYHNDENLCEGMVWCWALISYMKNCGNTKYFDTVLDALNTVMGKNGKMVPRNTIVPFAIGEYPAYHIYVSKRIQEQFFGISILTEMYKLTNNNEFLDFAIKSAETVISCYQNESGALIPHTDYTTVCAPVIPLVDLALLLKEIDEEKSKYFAKVSEKIVEFLVNRGFSFPTEGEISEINDEEMEEGSISCTALSILYYCRYIEQKKEYIAFAKKVLNLHDWWRSYTPDVRLNMSTMRWWETIWEGDGTGPAICAGHAWSIWRAEADFYMAVLSDDPEYFIRSWNGFMTNFSKTTSEGRMYACYQPDYFTGGGDEKIRKGLMQLSSADIQKQYKITRDYPKHYDNSLSRYVWVRACPTWLKTAVVILTDGKEQPIALNCVLEQNTINVTANIEQLYLFGDFNDYTIVSKKNIDIKTFKRSN